MKTINKSEYDALPEERRKYWNPYIDFYANIVYTPIQINLEDAERVLEEAREKFKKEYESAMSPYHATLDIFDEALSNLKQLTK